MHRLLEMLKTHRIRSLARFPELSGQGGPQVLTHHTKQLSAPITNLYTYIHKSCLLAAQSNPHAHIQTCFGNNTPKYRDMWNFRSISSFSRALAFGNTKGQNCKQVFFAANFSKSYFIALLLFKAWLTFPQLRHKFCRQLE